MIHSMAIRHEYNPSLFSIFIVEHLVTLWKYQREPLLYFHINSIMIRSCFDTLQFMICSSTVHYSCTLSFWDISSRREKSRRPDWGCPRPRLYLSSLCFVPREPATNPRWRGLGVTRGQVGKWLPEVHQGSVSGSGLMGAWEGEHTSGRPAICLVNMGAFLFLHPSWRHHWSSHSKRCLSTGLKEASCLPESSESLADQLYHVCAVLAISWYLYECYWLVRIFWWFEQWPCIIGVLFKICLQSTASN